MEQIDSVEIFKLTDSDGIIRKAREQLRGELEGEAVEKIKWLLRDTKTCQERIDSYNRHIKKLTERQIRNLDKLEKVENGSLEILKTINIQERQTDFEKEVENG